jgi:hypothetical protein
LNNVAVAGGKFHDSIRKSIFYTNLGADRRGFDRNARIESPKRSLRFQLGHGFGSGMRKKEEAANEAVCSGVIAPRRNNNAHLHRPWRAITAHRMHQAQVDQERV